MKSFPLLRRPFGRLRFIAPMASALLIRATSGMGQEPVPPEPVPQPALLQEAARNRAYFSVDLGASFIQSATVKSSGPFIQGGKMKFDPGLQLDMAFGAQFGSLAVELETGIIANTTGSIQDEFGVGDFYFYQVPFLANFYYHIPTGSRFHPFVGVGVGGVATILENYDLYYGSSDNAFGFGWQGLAGCTYQISRTIDLGLRYKYLGVADRTFDSLDLKMGWTHTHSVTAYFSLKF